MGYIVANAVAILAATVVGLGLGALCHALLGRRTGSGVTAGFVITAAIAEAWLAAILAGALILAPPAGPGPWIMALASAGVIWTGFVLPTTVITGRHLGASFRTVASHALHWLAVMLAQAATLQAMGLVRPG